MSLNDYPNRSARLSIGADYDENDYGQSVVTDPESGTDVTNYLINGGLTVDEEPAYQDEGFVNVLGELRRTLIGRSIKISASLNMVPADDAETIIGILSDEKVGIVCAAPIQRAVVCTAPTVSSVLVLEDSIAEDTDGGLWYNITFDAGGIIPLDGL